MSDDRDTGCNDQVTGMGFLPCSGIDGKLKLFEKALVMSVPLGGFLGGLEISDWQGYLCGPPPMVDAACQLLEKHGINSDEIFYDKFTDSSNL